MESLLDTKDLTHSDILKIFEETDKMREYLAARRASDKKSKELCAKYSGLLKGRSVVLLFYENSTRTALSFEKAAQFLGADVSNLPVAASSVKKGESLADTALTIDAFGTDLVVMRHQMSGAPAIFDKYITGKLINGGDGLHAHPTQALYDMYTIYDEFGGKVEKLKIAIIGDIKHSRVARSNIDVMNKFGITPVVYGPKTLIPLGLKGASVAESLEAALKDADAVMGLRIQLERQKCGLFPGISEYARYYGINPEKFKLAKPGAFVMHPGPVNRGAELSDTLVESERCIKDKQSANGLALRMALMKMILE